MDYFVNDKALCITSLANNYDYSTLVTGDLVTIEDDSKHCGDLFEE